jgi:hypothetical protein
MSLGRLVPFSPEDVSSYGYKTPVITQHLPPGAITYSASGSLKIPQAGGRRRRSRKGRKGKKSQKGKKSRKGKKARKTRRKH